MAQEKFGAGLYAVHRVDLHKELVRLATGAESDQSGRPARRRLNSAIVQVSPGGTVTLHDETVHSADIVIGGDGIRSIVRDCVLGDDAAQQPVHSSMAVFRFLVDSHALESDPDLRQFLEGSRCIVNMLVDTQTNRERRMLWYGCH